MSLAIAQRQLRCRTGRNLFDFVLTEYVCAEYEITIECDRNGNAIVIQYLHALVRSAASDVGHVGLGAKVDANSSGTEVGLHKPFDCAMAVRVSLWVWH
jgi:hypothetical protein